MATSPWSLVAAQEEAGEDLVVSGDRCWEQIYGHLNGDRGDKEDEPVLWKGTGVLHVFLSNSSGVFGCHLGHVRP